jgi:nucleoside-diphosphate-sugar epimerase
MANRILLTGSKGFIARTLVPMLEARGHEVVLHTGDVREAESFTPFMGQGITHLVHLAAKTFVPAGWENPALVYDVNVRGTLQALEFCRAEGAKMLFFSTYVYGTPDYLPVDEGHPVRPPSPYHHSKALGEDLCRHYQRYFGVGVTVLRPFNVYGPGQDDRFVIPAVLGQVLDPAVSEVLVHTLRPKRDFIFLDDFVEGACLALEAQGDGFEIFNLGYGESFSVEELVQAAMRATGIEKPYRANAQERPNEVLDLSCDTRHAREQLGFVPRTDLETGLKKIVSAMR